MIKDLKICNGRITEKPTTKKDLIKWLNTDRRITLNQIKKEFEKKGFKFVDSEKGYKFFKQIGTKKHNCEILFYKNFQELLKFYKNDLR